MEILVENLEEFLTAGYVVFEKSSQPIVPMSDCDKVRTICAKPKPGKL